MPGILPMKVIKVGSSSQSRVAQACDRCRSKKIRCDGLRPTCTQCAAVGFECRTSDKLSRRAFPRGYTESLEERVRLLETEVRELKDLLDEKDEKIDMLSKMHGNQRRGSSVTTESYSPSSTATDVKKEAHSPKEDTFRVHASPLLLGVENSDSFFMGSSSGRLFIENFKRKVQETGKPCADFNPEAFLHIQGCVPLTSQPVDPVAQAPPRLFSDRCVNIYFQEMSPLFPVLHKPAFLRVYEEFVADPAKIKSPHKNAQLYLVFSIAGISSESPSHMQHVAGCEQHWVRALDTVLMENTMATLQCLVLAMLYCSIRADYKRLQHYKAIAVGLSHRLGLHQSQKHFSFGALTTETRKKVFWTLYALDCFTAALLGLPKLLHEEDVHAEYPADTDDEYVTEKGFQPTLPGEYTRISSALALFRASRILARVLEKNYRAASVHELSLQQMSALETELDEWYDELPAHLRLNFTQDKPATDVTGSRSPLLALAYYYIRTLIYRPAVGSSLGPKSAPALLATSESSKHIIQITQLLEERSMAFSFCMNKTDLLVVCSMTLLYQTIDLKKDSKLVRDNERLVNEVLKTLESAGASGWAALRRVASMFISVEQQSRPAASSTSSLDSASASSKSMPAPSRHESPTHGGYRGKRNGSQKPTVKTLGCRPEAAASETELLQQQEKLRRMTVPDATAQRPDLHRSPSRQSFDSMPPETLIQLQQHRLSLSQASPGSHRTSSLSQHARPNLDYLSFSTTPSQSQPTTPAQGGMQPPQAVPAPNGAMAGADPSHFYNNAKWEALLGSMDSGFNNVYDAIYGGSSCLNEPSISSNTNGSVWSPDSWDLSNFSIGGDVASNPAAPHSALSISDESLSSADDAAGPPSELGLRGKSADFHGQMMAGDIQNGDCFVVDGADIFGL